MHPMIPSQPLDLFRLPMITKGPGMREYEPHPRIMVFFPVMYSAPF